jgi:hypothetical protein
VALCSRIAATNSETLSRRVLLINLVDSTQCILPVSPEWEIRDVTWAPDGRSLFALGLRALSQFIVQIELDGKAHVIPVILDQGKKHALYSLHPMVVILPSARLPGKVTPGSWKTSNPTPGAPQR